MVATNAAQTTNAMMLWEPAKHNTLEGRPKIPAPMTPLRTTPTKSQRRSERTNPRADVRSIGNKGKVTDSFTVVPLFGFRPGHPSIDQEAKCVSLRRRMFAPARGPRCSRLLEPARQFAPAPSEIMLIPCAQRPASRPSEGRPRDYLSGRSGSGSRPMVDRHHVSG